MRFNLIKVLSMLSLIPNVHAMNMGGVQDQLAGVIQMILATMAMVPYGMAGMTQESVASVGVLKIALLVISFVLIKEAMNRIPIFEGFEEKSKKILNWVVPLVITFLTPNGLLEMIAEPIGQFLFIAMSIAILSLGLYVSFQLLKKAEVF
jgi:hypothetical protein